MKKKQPEWQSGNPTKAGYYVIAIAYDNGMGIYAADYWDTENGWQHDDNIIGYIPLNQVIDGANIEWPEYLTP